MLILPSINSWNLSKEIWDIEKKSKSHRRQITKYKCLKKSVNNRCNKKYVVLSIPCKIKKSYFLCFRKYRVQIALYKSLLLSKSTQEISLISYLKLYKRIQDCKDMTVTFTTWKELDKLFFKTSQRNTCSKNYWTPLFQADLEKNFTRSVNFGKVDRSCL